jgi:uncharacterized protein YunC (DUF1805 family)
VTAEEEYLEEVVLENGTAFGVRIPLFSAPLIMIKAPRGYLMCGYLDMATAEKVGDACAIVRGVATVEDALEAEVLDVSSKARSMGINEGMRGREALEAMF